ncbi:MAG TPA: alpha-L-fucosidase [Salinivirgaceae bacterium]|nr:alpha-L-fucosidase [Salinivirgaceae bacterium]
MKYKIFSLFFCFTLLASAQQKPSQRWLDQKFSMFIHFGLYSVYGGVYEGKPVERGYSEQIQSFAGIFSDWYGNTARQFNPTKWNPDKIVQLAKDAGMRSIVFTSKHHDGFCMYHSQYTDFNIVDATPYGRDLMKELADACKRGGIDFAVYYSLIDWHYPHAYPISSHNADPLTDEHYEFNKKQVEEIMTNYGDISEIWFDMGSLTHAQSKGLYELVNQLQPQCMISGRLGNDYVDFSVMADNEYPDYKLGIPWQTAASMFNETWGYRSWQKRGSVQEKVDEKIASLIKVVSRGGNYLLNIGPRGDGSVVEFERDVLLEMGKWVKTNSEAIYGTNANPFHTPFQGYDVTTKGDTLYFFVPKGEVTQFQEISSSHLLKAEVSPISASYGEAPFTVFKVTGFEVKPQNILSRNASLTPQNSTPTFGYSSLNYYAGYKTLIGYDWFFRSNKRSLSPEICFTDSEQGEKIEININGNKHEITLSAQSSKKQTLDNNSVKWGNLYRKSGRGTFGNVREEGIENIDVQADENFKLIPDFNYNESYTEEIIPRRSFVLLQEIESTKPQTIAVEIESGNAAYILLNGKYITAHFSPKRIKRQKEIFLLPLNKGKNQLVVKFYSGYEKEITYGIKPLTEWTLHTIKLTPVSIDRSNDYHHISIRKANPESKVSPLRMNNIEIKL